MIRQQPERGALGTDVGADLERLTLRHAHTEFHHVVHIVGAYDACNGIFLALSVDDDGAGGSLEGREVADGLAALTGIEAVGRGYHLTVG